MRDNCWTFSRMDDMENCVPWTVSYIVHSVYLLCYMDKSEKKLFITAIVVTLQQSKEENAVVCLGNPMPVL